MRFNLSSLILFAANLLLLFLCSLVNTQLTTLSLYLVLLGLMPVLPALYLKYPAFLVCSFLSGLCVDAGLASDFGLFTCGFPIIGTFIRWMRLRFRSESEYGYRLILLSHLANLVCIVLLQLSHHLKDFFQPVLWVQLLAVTLFSHVVLFIVGPWFFRLEWMLSELLKLEFHFDDELTAP